MQSIVCRCILLLYACQNDVNEISAAYMAFSATMHPGGNSPRSPHGTVCINWMYTDYTVAKGSTDLNWSAEYCFCAKTAYYCYCNTLNRKLKTHFSDIASDKTNAISTAVAFYSSFGTVY